MRKSISILSNDSTLSLLGSRFALAFLIDKASVKALIASSWLAPVVVPVIFLTIDCALVLILLTIVVVVPSMVLHARPISA